MDKILKQKKTIYKHYCDACIYLGPFKDKNKQTFDLYFCQYAFNCPTVVARYSNETWDVFSGLLSKKLACVEAKHRAELLGLI